MNSFLKIAGPVAAGITVTVGGLAITNSPVALDAAKNIAKQVGVVALRVTSEVILATVAGGATGAMRGTVAAG